MRHGNGQRRKNVEKRGVGMELKKESLESRAAEALRNRIVEGEIPPGSRLTETELAKDFNISRGTLRTALHQLVGEGLVRQVPYTGWLVQELSARAIRELHSLRAAYDRLASTLVADSMNEEKKKSLAKAYAQLEQACETGDPVKVARADFHLHHTVVSLSGHSMLEEYYTRVEQQLRLYIKWSTQVMPDCRRVAEDHRPFYEALIRGDGETAGKFAEEHNNLETRLVVTQLEKRENLPGI